MTERKMEFVGDIHKDFKGHFSTVRRGLKWADLRAGDIIKIAIAGTEFSWSAVVTNVKKGEFGCLEPEDYENNFDPECRDWAHLLLRMATLYPGFREDEIVTVIELKDYQIGHGG